MTVYHEPKRLRLALAMGTAAALLWSGAIAADKKEGIFETNLTSNQNIGSGEPEIAVDPTNPSRLAVIGFDSGAPRPLPQGISSEDRLIASTEWGARILLSNDRGETWKATGDRSPASLPGSPLNGGGDPMIAYGPDGTLYAGSEPGPYPGAFPRGQENLNYYSFILTASTDGGRTFITPKFVPTPVDRPWLEVDQSTGKVYTVSSGYLNLKNGEHNVAGPDATHDRWLVAWAPHLSSRSEPHRIGGPDFSGASGNTITAAHGVIAATFVIGGPAPGAGFTGSPPPATPVPASLKDVMRDGVTSCSQQAPCLFFETSADDGQTWKRHHVVVRGGFIGRGTNVAADPGRPGRYAVAVVSADRANMLVMVTDDSGATWSGPITVPQIAKSGANFKPWMRFGPTGVLGLMWRKERDDMPAPAAAGGQAGAAGGPGYDIYAAISCNGGKKWLPSVRVNAQPSRPGNPGRDDVSHIALDANYAHLVWGDRREGGRTQSYYGRVPFSLLAGSASCGRK